MVHQQRLAQAGLLLSAGLGVLSGLVMLGLGVWTVRDKAFLDELLRNKLYMDAAYIILVASSLIILLSCFGCFAAMKEIKCFLLTYFILLLLFTVILMVSGVIAYVFREQVKPVRR
jgi:tetraspanin-11